MIHDCGDHDCLEDTPDPSRDENVSDDDLLLIKLGNDGPMEFERKESAGQTTTTSYTTHLRGREAEVSRRRGGRTEGEPGLKRHAKGRIESLGDSNTFSPTYYAARVCNAGKDVLVLRIYSGEDSGGFSDVVHSVSEVFR
ncbi:hypothetical protein J6590_071306 [Homalodisca vitripennis]|nr:hypothetical protein J6590_071306 [Homalodisca vitripennis]